MYNIIFNKEIFYNKKKELKINIKLTKKIINILYKDKIVDIREVYKNIYK